MNPVYIPFIYTIIAGIGLLLGWHGYSLDERGDGNGRRYKLIGGLILAGCVMVHFLGCAQQPPPPPVVVAAPTPTPTPTPTPINPNAELPPDAASAAKSGSTEMVESGIAKFYPYDANSEWTINCQPFTATEIRLAPDETTDDQDVILGDNKRFDMQVGDHVVLIKATANQTYIDPKTGKPMPGDYDVRGNIVIHTSQGRIYHIELKLKKPLTPVIAWYYPQPAPVAQATPSQQEASKQ